MFRCGSEAFSFCGIEVLFASPGPIPQLAMKMLDWIVGVNVELLLAVCRWLNYRLVFCRFCGKQPVNLTGSAGVAIRKRRVRLKVGLLLSRPPPAVTVAQCSQGGSSLCDSQRASELDPRGSPSSVPGLHSAYRLSLCPVGSERSSARRRTPLAQNIQKDGHEPGNQVHFGQQGITLLCRFPHELERPQ